MLPHVMLLDSDCDTSYVTHTVCTQKLSVISHKVEFGLGDMAEA